MSYPFYCCTSTSFFFIRFEREREEKRGYYGHSYAAPPVRLRGCTLWPLSAQGSAIPMGTPMYPIQRPPPPPCSRSLNTISPFNRHRLRSRFSLLFPLPPCVYQPRVLPLSVLLVLFFFFFFFSFARGDRKDGYSETRRKKVLSGATRVCLTGNTARIESRLSSANGCLCRASTISFE